MHHPPLLPQLVSSSGWRSSLLSSSWSAWTCGKESSQSHQPEVNFTKHRHVSGCERVISQENPITHLFDSDADSDRVDGSLDENFLLVISTDDHRLKQQLFTAPVTTTPFSHGEKSRLKLLDPADFCRSLRNTSAQQNVASPHRPILQPCPHLLFFFSLSLFFFSSYIFSYGGTGTANQL